MPITVTPHMQHNCFQVQLLDLERQLSDLAARLYADNAKRDANLQEAATEAQCALEACTHLVGAAALVGPARTVPHAEALLRQVGGVARTANAPTADEFAGRLPALLRVVLGLLFDSQVLEDDPGGPAAIATRLVATMVEIIEGHADA